MSHSQASSPAETLTPRTDLVRVVFTVTDSLGKYVKGLRQDQFKILDDDEPPKEIVSFEAQTELPLRIGLLIDASNPIRDRFSFEQEQAAGFLRQIVRTATDKAFVLAFDEVVDVVQDFTGDSNQLTRGIKGIRSGTGTAVWDALYYACRDKMMKEKNTTPVRRVIILMSGGDDDQSRVLRQEAIDMAQRAEVIVYTINTTLSKIHDTGDHNLQILAAATGGRSFSPLKLQDLADDFNEIRSELRSQYSISYTPNHLLPNGQYHSIRILVDNPKLVVRARKGYFAATR